jgi:hypothetical protein
MTPQEFELHDGSLTVKVNGNGKTITLDFDITDSSHASPVIDMAKFDIARGHALSIRDAILALSPNATVSDIENALKKNSHLEMSITLDEAHYRDAILAIRTLITASARSAEAWLEPAGGYDIPTEDVPQSPRNISFMQRLRKDARRTLDRGILKDWALDDLEVGMSGSVFVTDKSLVTGREEDGDNKLIAVKIIPGSDTKDARRETHHFTQQIENRLMARGLHVRSSEVYLGSDPSGKQDTGVILLHTGADIVNDLERVSGVMDVFQQDHHVFRQKLGSRHRGEDHRHRSVRKPGPMETELKASLREAIASGLLKLNGTPHALQDWVEETAKKLQAAQGEDIDPPQRQAGKR